MLVVPLEEASEAVSTVLGALENLEVEALAEHGAAQRRSAEQQANNRLHLSERRFGSDVIAD